MDQVMSLGPNYKAELVGVFGYPVSENPTVVMQEAAFRALSLNWRYLTSKCVQKIWARPYRDYAPSI